MSTIPSYPDPAGALSDASLFLGYSGGRTCRIAGSLLLTYVRSGLQGVGGVSVNATTGAISLSDDVKTVLGLDQVENKSAATILGELSAAEVEAALDFMPANRAGDTFGGTVGVGAANVGGIDMHPGDGVSPGYVEFRRPDGSRKGYAGYAPDPNGPIIFGADDGLGIDFDGGPVGNDSDPTLGKHLTRLSWLQGASGGQNVGVQHPSTGGGLRTVYARALEDMRVTDFYDGVPDNLKPQGRTSFINSFDDTPYWQAAFNACRALGVTRLRAPSSFYRVASDGTGLDVNCAVDFHGDGYIESGAIGGVPIIGGAGEAAIGTYVKCQPADGYQGIVVGGGNARGARFRDFVVVQDHPQPVGGWVPNNYDYVFRNNNSYGATEYDITLLGVNKGINLKNCGRVIIHRLAGQCFTNAIQANLVEDVLYFGIVHLWTYWSSSPWVVGYQQANLDAITLGRCDGGAARRVLVLGARKALNIQDFGNGQTQDFHSDYFYAEEVKYGVYVDIAGTTLSFSKLKTQCQDYGSNGNAIAGSRGIWLTGNAGGSHLSVYDLKQEYCGDAGIRNDSNSAMSIGRWRASAWPSGSGSLWYSPTTPIECAFNPITETGVVLGASGQLKVPTYGNFN